MSPSKVAKTIACAITMLKRAGHDAIARDLETEPRCVGMALVTLEGRITNAGTITADELRAKKLLEQVLLLEEDPDA